MELDRLQAELLAGNPSTKIRLLGVNEFGQQVGNVLIPPLGVLPWLQDVDPSQAWGPWGVAYRDVVILDTATREVSRYNLTINDLKAPDRYAQLRALLEEVAGE